MAQVPIQILRFTHSYQPGFVDFQLVDAWGKKWLFTEKVPVISDEWLDKNSDYPRPETIECEVVKRWTDAQGRQLVTIDTERPWGLEAEEETTRFDVLQEQLIEG